MRNSWLKLNRPAGLPVPSDTAINPVGLGGRRNGIVLRGPYRVAGTGSAETKRSNPHHRAASYVTACTDRKSVV